MTSVFGRWTWNKLPLTQGWAWRSSMIGRFLGSSYRHFEIISKHSGVSFLLIAGFILYFPAFIASIVYSELDPLKGNSPVSMAYSMTPVDQTSILPSTLYPLFFTKHSGAIQAKLPASKSSQVRDLITPAIPKSIILIFLFSLFTNKIFSSFRSRWIRPFEWQQLIAFTICLKKTFAVSSSNFYYFCTYCRSQPPCRHYMMMATCIFLRVRQLCTRTMLSCFNDFSVSASTKIPSIQAAVPILSVLMILIANCYPVCLCLASRTWPNPPSPNFLTIQYSPKQLAGSKSSPLEAYRTDLDLINQRSSSKYSAPSELNSLKCGQSNAF